MIEEFNDYITNNEVIQKIIYKVNEYVSLNDSEIKIDYYENHIIPTAYYAYVISENESLDTELCVIAALLHDIARYKKEWIENHEFYSSEMAKEILSEINYPVEKINKISLMILNHRLGNYIYIDEYLYQIIADADVLAFINNIEYFCEFEKSVGMDILGWLLLKRGEIYAKISNMLKTNYQEDINNFERKIVEWKR